MIQDAKFAMRAIGENGVWVSGGDLYSLCASSPWVKRMTMSRI